MAGRLADPFGDPFAAAAAAQAAAHHRMTGRITPSSPQIPGGPSTSGPRPR